ncbi:hypothetical protein F8388_003882 [Cannabis sativa]|uniref:Ubiquitin-like domain-containing protein n=1 Tax=Cannabis sativa TaxID=3483 RepID=A0A7J6GNR1_CANSA|nr:hypothetical protein F8388_003882 [Cannabis sativa]KAF4401020.1 hypothetical protein G4B88_013861 [Cannabis sativa]
MDVTAISGEPRIYQLMVMLLQRKTLILRYTTPQVYANDVKHRLQEITKIPSHLQRLITGSRHLDDDSVLSCADEDLSFPTVHLTLRLRGGKGGFGSLLRGAGTRNLKKTNNFDACRDMSGRRLRHVNAEKRLEEWKATEEERKLEKKAHDFLKKVAKKGKKGAGDGAAEKYVAKYREESERCVSEVLDSVREAVKGKREEGLKGKRKGAFKGDAADAKRLKIWMGKRQMGVSDSDDSDEDDESDVGKESEKSTVLNNGNHSDSSKDGDDSSGSVTGAKQVGEFSGGSSSESGPEEEEKASNMQETKESSKTPIVNSIPCEGNDVYETASQKEKMDQTLTVSCSEFPDNSETEAVQDEKDPVVDNVPTSSCGNVVETLLSTSESRPIESDPGVQVEASSSGNAGITETPLDFDQINSAAELEALGLERLKTELQTRGLKCGGTLQERAARLFLLKSTPLEKLPKKLLAKK